MEDYLFTIIMSLQALAGVAAVVIAIGCIRGIRDEKKQSL